MSYSVTRNGLGALIINGPGLMKDEFEIQCSERTLCIEHILNKIYNAGKEDKLKEIRDVLQVRRY